MRLIPSDPDIATLLSRIKSGDIDLQPDFQRGEVWSYSKKQKLIDSILREWHVPPIHVIESKSSGRQDVLDGQQRLVAIRDFANGKVRIDGGAEPQNDAIMSLDGFTYSDLPDFYRRRFDQFTIRLFRIIDYSAAEPGELFFRLNQPVGLTSAEQRNAFFGKTRQQIRDIVGLMDKCEIDKSFIGFSNSRMAYDDIVARVAMTLDDATLSKKIDAARLASQYRSETPFSESTIARLERAIPVLSYYREIAESKFRFNKATLYSWILFIVRAQDEVGHEFNGQVFAKFLTQFENWRNGVTVFKGNFSHLLPISNELRNIYEDRSTSRVGNVSSVLYRDLAIWILFIALDFGMNIKERPTSNVARLRQALINRDSPVKNESQDFQEWLNEVAQYSGWSSI